VKHNWETGHLCSEVI